MFQSQLESCCSTLFVAVAYSDYKGETVNRNDFSITDAEYLYMIRQMNHGAMERVNEHYVRLLWRRSHDMYNMQMPDGISVDDLYQEAYIGFKEALYAFNENRQVGLAYYLNLCVVSSIQTALRKCRSGNFSLLNPRYSLDIPVGDTDSVSRIDLVQTQHFYHDPRRMALYGEVQEISRDYLQTLKQHEQKVYTLHELGHSYALIAESVDISTKDVDNIIQKVRRNLRLILND